MSEGFDRVLREGALRDSGMITRRLGRFQMVNDAQAYQAACIAGLGLIQAPTMVNPHGLVEVLPTFVAEPMSVSLLYAHRAGSKRLHAWMAWPEDVLATRLIDRVMGRIGELLRGAMTAPNGVGQWLALSRWLHSAISGPSSARRRR